jgi:hypothetical protein
MSDFKWFGRPSRGLSAIRALCSSLGLSKETEAQAVASAENLWLASRPFLVKNIVGENYDTIMGMTSARPNSSGGYPRAIADLLAKEANTGSLTFIRGDVSFDIPFSKQEEDRLSDLPHLLKPTRLG